MKAILLAAGYGTRLRPLTDRTPKELLHVGGRPIIDWIFDAVAALPEVDEVHVVTNASKIAAFEAWAARRDVTLHNDGTTSNDDRLGATGDIRFVVERAGLAADDLLVVAGDNLFDYSLADYVDWWRGRGEASAVALYDVGDLELVKKYSSVELDDDDRLTGFVEKPEQPTSSLVATATYLFHRAHIPLVPQYLAEGNSPDQPGRFVAWLVPRAPVYGYRFDGEWRDIGDAEQLLEADNLLRERAGLALRDRYALD
jgi:glucose-1-phosphate thymidylyltransferase